MILKTITDSQATLIQDLKSKSFEMARLNRMAIQDENSITVGYLIPIGLWVEAETQTITSISSWRGRDMKNFLVQFDSTFEKTKAYLVNKSIKEPDRILFLIVDQFEILIGHLGLSKINSDNAELDNLMRGVPGGPKDLMELAEKTVIDFAFSKLGVNSVSLRVLSFNFLAISIHQRLGFIVIEREYLKKSIVGDEICHDPVPKGDSNVDFSCLIMVKNR